MRKLFPLLIFVFTASALCQDKIAVARTGEFLDQKYWSNLGKPTEGSRGFALFSRDIKPKTDTVFEVWIKVVPTNASAFNKRYGLPRNAAYAVQFATIDCTKRLVFMENTSAYDANNVWVDATASDLVQKVRTRVKSGSISETAFDYICVKL